MQSWHYGKGLIYDRPIFPSQPSSGPELYREKISFIGSLNLNLILLGEILAYNKSALCRSASPTFRFVLLEIRQKEPVSYIYVLRGPLHSKSFSYWSSVICSVPFFRAQFQDVASGARFSKVLIIIRPGSLASRFQQFALA